MPTSTTDDDGRQVRDLASEGRQPIDPGLGVVYDHLGELARELRRTQGIVGELRDRLNR
jgi:hypothetical protein